MFQSRYAVLHESAFGPKQTCESTHSMSFLGVKRTFLRCECPLLAQGGHLYLHRTRIQVLSVALRLIGVGFHASLPIMRRRPPCCALASSRGALRAHAQETKCDQALARLWFLTRLSPTRGDRTRTRCALLQGLRPTVLRSSVAGLLSRKMERRRVRSLLDADADWADVELWPIAPNNWPGARSNHLHGFTSYALRTVCLT
jgi:hypothetical protein